MSTKSKTSEYKIQNYLSSFRMANPSFEINENDRPWVLKKRTDNLIRSSYYEKLLKFYNDIDTRGLIHTLFQSLKSSQAMAINFFGVLSSEKETFIKLLNDYKCSININDNISPHFEYLEDDAVLGGNPDNFDKTNFDFVLNSQNETAYFEFKYTESNFGKLVEEKIISHDKRINLPPKDNYQYKYEKLYKPLLRELGICFDSFKDFYADYQIWRNITYTKYGHVFFVFPEYRDDLTEEVNNCLCKMTDEFYKNRVHIMYTDRITKKLKNQTNNKQIQKHFSMFWEKYFGFI